MKNNKKTVFDYLATCVVAGVGVGLSYVAMNEVIMYAENGEYRNKVNNKVKINLKQSKTNSKR